MCAGARPVGGARAGDPHLRNHDQGELFDDGADQIHPYLAGMLGLSLDPDTEGEIAALSPEARAFRTTEAVAGLIRRLAQERPAILGIEDLHWADPTSTQLFERLFPLVEAEPALLVASLRPEPDHPSWGLHGRAVREHPGPVRVMTLGALPKGVDRDLLQALVGPGTLPADVERRIFETAEGNPLYLEELVRSLIDAGALLPEEGGWRFQSGMAVDIPPTLERVIISRIDRLSPKARGTIQAASVLGRQFARELLEAMTGGDGALTEALDELTLVDLLREGAGSEYRFKHALIQEAAYSNMLRRRRRELHAGAAEALQTLFGDRLESLYGVLAQHYRGAARLEEALRYFELAAAGAQRVYAVEAALDHYTAALEVAESLGSDRTPHLLLRRGQVRAQAGQLEAAIAGVGGGGRDSRRYRGRGSKAVGLSRACRGLRTMASDRAAGPGHRPNGPLARGPREHDSRLPAR